MGAADDVGDARGDVALLGDCLGHRPQQSLAMHLRDDLGRQRRWAARQ
jgi:hypothetical protein